MNAWIPCAERLPDKSGNYLVTGYEFFTPDHVDEPNKKISIGIGMYSVAHQTWFGPVEIVWAWMPLPEPYKGG